VLIHKEIKIHFQIQ